MKNLLKISSLLLMIPLMFSCDKNDEDCVCIEIYQPVCGEDGVEYSNSCYAECAGVSYTEGTCAITSSAIIRDMGNPALDGCGWVIDLGIGGESEIYRPDTLAEEFKVNQLAIELTYKMTSDSSICGMIAFIPVLEVVGVVEQ